MFKKLVIILGVVVLSSSMKFKKKENTKFLDSNWISGLNIGTGNPGAISSNSASSSANLGTSNLGQAFGALNFQGASQMNNFKLP